MSDKYAHTLSNGYTFLAVTSGIYGSWAKATDPLTAVRNAAKAAGSSKPVAVRCYFGANESTWVDDFGSVHFSKDSGITPIGFFVVKNSSVKPLAKGEFNENHDSHEEWMERSFKELAPPADSA
jgi:hypothetical protein